jgi:hypothetical protein
MDLALEWVCDYSRCPAERCQFLPLRRLDSAGEAATADFRVRALASVDDDLWRFLVYAEFPRTSRARSRLRELVQRRPEAFVTDRGGKDRR